MRSLLPACSLLILLGGAMHAHALGLGEARVRSDLSSPLLIEIPIVDLAGAGVAAEEVRVTVPDDAEQRALGAAEPILPHGVRVRVVAGETGGALVRLTTDRASREPVLRFALRATWDGGVAVRAYELIVDPPFVAMPQRRLDAPRIQPVTAAPPASSYAGRARLLPPPGGPRTPAQAGTRYGPVRAGDTLYAIIAEAYPALAATPGRAAADLVARNPGAFIGGDPGRVLQGATLDLPAAEALELAPAASSPRSPAASAEPAGAASSGSPAAAVTDVSDGTRYTVRPGDTLYGIVRGATGAGGAALAAAVDRVFAANPQAFIDGDRDRLRVGAVVAIDGLPAASAAPGSTAPPVATGATAAPQAPAAAPADAGSAALAEAVASARSELATLEQAVAAERALETDLSARLDRILEEAAALQEREARLSIETAAVRERLAARLSEAPAAPAGDAGAAAPAATAAPDPAPAAREPTTAAGGAAAPGAVVSAAASAAPANAMAANGGTPVSSAPPPAPEGLVEQVLGALSGAASASGILIAAVAAALVGLLALLALRRRRSSAAPEKVHKAATQANEDAARRRLAEVREQHEGANTGDFTDDGEVVRAGGERKVVMTDAAQANKLAKEAAVHMAYGNMEESKACILEAIRLDPGRDEHKMMLITIYESTNEHGKARAIVDDLLKRREELPQDLRLQVERKLEAVKAG